jgi:hypothetical protein
MAMRNALTAAAAAIGAIGTLICLTLTTAQAQQPASRPQRPRYQAPRAADGHADLNGIWQAVNTANWDLQDHPARRGPVTALGASFSIPAGVGVVEGNEIPYQPWAAEKKKQNAEHWLTLDPEIKCYMPGVPRATYTAHPFQIVQSRDTVLIAYEFASASRIVRMSNPGEAPLDSWMGWSRGHWDGDTLVVDVTGLNDQTWFDRAGNFHSEALHVTERYTRTDPDHLSYEATIEDPKVFTRPWKISMPLYRRMEPNAQLLEYKCVEFVEELMYGHLQKK